MAVFHVEKNKDYTVMSNYHLRDNNLSLKAKGLLSQMLSLPEDWDYTLTGLSRINKESKDAIRSAVQELEKGGYIVRRQTMGDGGKFSSNEYVIFEKPQHPEESEGTVCEEENVTVVGKPDDGEKEQLPLLDFPTTETPSTENPTQLNIDISSKDIKKEKINKKERRPPAKNAFEPMPLFKDWIGSTFAAFSAQQKNSLYFALARFVENRVALKKPFKTKGAVTAFCNRLLRLTHESGDCCMEQMVELLDDATGNNWQTVYVRASPGAGQALPSQGREYEVV